MKVGIIGAGKVGCSLGMLLNLQYNNVLGFYSRSLQSSKEAAQFTKTKQYFELEELVEESDTIFLTAKMLSKKGIQKQESQKISNQKKN